jgi:N utilization substance protein B
MKARRASREMALLFLFQLETPQGTLPQQLPEKFDAATSLRLAVFALVRQAKSNLEEAATLFQTVSTQLMTYEFEHPDNLNQPMHAPQVSVPLSTTKETLGQLDNCLQAIELTWESLKIPELLAHTLDDTVVAYAVELVKIVCANTQRFDALIAEASTDWRAERMVKVDRLLIKLALAEITGIESVDTNVSVDEAVELAKEFSTEDSYKFINGILGKVLQLLETPTGASVIS